MKMQMAMCDVDAWEDSEGETDRSETLPAPFHVARDRTLLRFEEVYLRALMFRTGGIIARAAREADIGRHRLRVLLRKHGLYQR